MKRLWITLTGATALAGAAYAIAGDAEAEAAPAAPSPARDTAMAYSPPVRFAAEDTNLYWGDTHLHTSYSFDAFMMGNEVLSPTEAFRFARGEMVTSSNGLQVRLRRPLDFLLVSDHAEYLGVYPKLKAGDPAYDDWPLGKEWGGYLRAGDVKSLAASAVEWLERPSPRFHQPAHLRQSVWDEVGKTADRFNQPGKFTAIIGYEWTSMPAGDNLHRVVMFRDDASKTSRVLPFSSQDSTDPEKLWEFLGGYERDTGGRVLAIPHNGNVSNGRMFAPQRENGAAFTAAYAKERMRWEPVVEVTQVKGDGEAHPSLSPTDEFADFETWDTGNISMSAPKKPEMLRYEYARSALREGLAFEGKLGVNPYKFGMIGSTDSHTGLSTAAEDNFWGKYLNSEPAPNRGEAHWGKAEKLAPNWELGASGLAAAWAPENTRGAIFDAFKRREVYATTGSRIQLRFFGGWSFAASDAQRPDYARIGYKRGVPMGGELMRAAKGKAPSFMVVAARDPDEANLDRIQVIKGWLDAKGQTHEKIYDVALSGGRKVDPKTGKAPAVGNTVDVANATYTNAIGAPELATVWTDPDFDPALKAFYYVRVLEIPKPRWTAYDAKYFKLKMPSEVPMTIQDRAYSSPIWYNP